MAWKASGNTISMAEGDFGIALPGTIHGIEFSASDSIRFTFKDVVDGHTILTKEFSNISNDTVYLILTEAESSLFSVGKYVYSLDWYQDGVFMCNIIPVGNFKVVNKA